MIIFDVGANNGSSCSHLVNDENIVYAFEPTPFLLEKYLYAMSSKNYIVIPKAVSNFNGEAQFNIAGQADWGCSSLNNFSDNLQQTWNGRTDFKVTKVINVKVIKMHTFIEENNIQTVDFLHCDTQGNDLKVLKSFENKISILKSGTVEAFAKNPLYKENDNSVENIVSFLRENNFKINQISNNDHFGNEVNISFSRL
jgi:FkbM family methyltransferase